MGGVDKGLVILKNQPLIQHVIQYLTPQTDEILINANREILRYQAFGYPVLQDFHADFIGPLAGFYLGLQHAKYEYLLTVPCDSPHIPLDLAHRLLAYLKEKNATKSRNHNDLKSERAEPRAAAFEIIRNS